MSLLTYFDKLQLSAMLRVSNYWAHHNSNNYPVKLQNAINEIYERIPCPCDINCSCKKYDCKTHLVRKEIESFEDIYKHFLNCYVDEKAHDAIRNKRETGRGSRSVKATEIIFANWDEYGRNLNQNSLICDQFLSEPYLGFSKSFTPSGENIYQSKWLALLNLGVCLAYDTGSVKLLKRDYNNPKTYFLLLKALRSDLIQHLDKNHVKIDDFCMYDKPGEFYSAIPNNSIRPIGNILDKMYLTL